MPYAKKFLSYLVAMLLVSGCQAAPSSPQYMNNTVSDQSDFITLLKYEAQNRAFAYQTLEGLVAVEEDRDKRTFWKAYLNLERLNKRKFSPIVARYGIDPEPNLGSKSKAVMTRWFNALFPNYLLKIMHKATLEYVTELKQMARLAPEEFKAFCRYVVDQEVVQKDAMGLVVEGRTADAVKLLNAFIANSQS